MAKGETLMSAERRPYWRSAFLFLLEAMIMIVPFAFVGGLIFALANIGYSDARAQGFVFVMIACYFFYFAKFAKRTPLLMAINVSPVGFYIRSGVTLILDFITAFFLFGYPIGIATGQMDGLIFRIQDLWALVVFAGIALYFTVGNSLLGGTPWRRTLAAS